MKKTIAMVIAVAVLGLVIGGGVDRAEAMNNESAAMLAGAIAIFGPPILNAVAGEIFPPPYPERQTIVHYRYSQPVKGSGIHRRHRHRHDCDDYRDAYRRGWCDEQERQEYRRGRHDARRYYDDEWR